MKKLISLLAGVLASLGVAKADMQKTVQLSVGDSKKVAEALELLKEKEVLNRKADGSIDVDQEVIQKLKDEGFLKNKRPELQTICGGTGGHS